MRARVPDWVVLALLALLLLAVTWPFGSPVPRPGLDRSWQIGLAMAFAKGLAFGRQIILNYGPLSFAIHPYRTSQGEYAVALLIGGLVQLALIVTLLQCLRRTFGLALAAIGTFLLASLLGEVQADPLTAVAFGLVVLTLTAPVERRVRAARWLAVAGGTVVAVAMLMKANNGIDCACVVALGLCGTPRPLRALAEGAASFCCALLAMWLLLGEPLGALPDYFRLTADYIRGYVDGAAKGTSGTAYTSLLLILFASAVVLGAGAWSSMRRFGRRPQIALTLAVLTLHYALFRESTTRAGANHGLYLALLAAVAAMLPWPRRTRVFGAVLALALWYGVFSFYPATPGDTLVPVTRARAMINEIRRAATPPNITRESTLIRRVDVVPPAVLSAVRGGCVSVEPWEIAVVWAYQLRWCPLPALQSYDAATSTLDHLDAAAYGDPRTGPDRVLRQLGSIDGRNATWESPAAMLALLCNFTEVARGGGWQALARVPDRCGAARPLTTLHTTLNRTVVLPAAPPGQALVADVEGLGTSFGERLASLIARVGPRSVAIDGRFYRVPADSSGDGLVIGVPANADYAPPFNLDMRPHTFSARMAGHGNQAVTVRLETVPIQPSEARP
jgi:hypothetical protein